MKIKRIIKHYRILLERETGYYLDEQDEAIAKSILSKI